MSIEKTNNKKFVIFKFSFYLKYIFILVKKILLNLYPFYINIKKILLFIVNNIILKQ